MAFITGTSNSETLNGTTGDDEFVGAGGDDILNGLAGNDVFRWFSGDGSDTIDGGDGTDKSVVTLTDNTGTSGQQFTLLADASGAAVFQFGTGTLANPLTTVNSMQNTEEFQLRLTPSVAFGAANIRVGNLTGTEMTGAIDIFNFSSSPITVNGTESVNTLRLIGGTGNDTLLGGTANDFIYGGAGDDLLFAGGGANEMVGGAGNDVYRVTSVDTVIENSGEGIDAIVTGDASYTLRANFENLIFVLDTAPGSPTDFTGIGNALDNIIQGGAGADYLIGLAGNDILIGGTGAANALQGGTGNDTYVVSVAGDTVIEFENEGIDTIRTDLTSYTLRANIENLRFTGTGPFSGTGNELANRIDGSTGNDFIRGLDGNDLLFGNDGNDVLLGGAGDDILQGGAGANELVGEAGADTFLFTALTDRADLIGDFIRADGDKIDISDLLDNVGASDDPFADGFVRLEASTFAGQPSTNVFIDADGSAGAGGEILLVQVLGSTPLTSSDFITV